MNEARDVSVELDWLKRMVHGAVDSGDPRPHDSGMNTPSREEVKAQLAAVEAKIGESEAKVDARLANFDASIQTGFAELRAEFAELRADIAHGRTEAAKQTNDNMKWMIGSVLALVSVAVTIIGTMINFSKSDKPAAAPLIVYAQPSPVAAAPAQAPAAQK
jgi:hypothetical protein